MTPCSTRTAAHRSALNRRPRAGAFVLTVMRWGILALLPATCLPPAVHAQAPRELRGAWVTAVDSDVLSSRARIADAMDFLGRHHFNVVYPAVWSRGYTLFRSGTAERAFGAAIDPAYGERDPFAELVLEAHRNGLEVVPWLVDGFAAGTGPGAQRLFAQQPGWFARDSKGQLLESNGTTWLDALQPEVQAFFTDLVVELAQRYDIDGIQGDDRFPALPAAAACNPKTAQLFSRSAHRLPSLDPREPEWLAFRANLLTDFLTDVRARLRAIDPRIVLSLAPGPLDAAYKSYAQDAKTWIDRGLVDVIHPRCYARGVEPYLHALDQEIDELPGKEKTPLAPGILAQNGSYAITREQLLACIAANRKRGLAGQVMFSTDAMRANGSDLAGALLAGPYAERATLPYRDSGPWRPLSIDVGFDPEFAIGEWSAIDGAATAWQSKSAGRAGTSYSARIEAGASYEVFLVIPKADDLPASATRSIRVGAHAAEAVTFALSPGVLSIARLPIESGTNVTVRIETGAQEHGRLALGRVFFLVDRKRSPRAVFGS